MDRDSMKQLRLDRRLIRRRGWISDQELAQELENLPDAAQNAITLGDAADEAKAPRAATPSGAPEVAPDGAGVAPLTWTAGPVCMQTITDQEELEIKKELDKGIFTTFPACY